jgi:hypothetical protein
MGFEEATRPYLPQRNASGRSQREAAAYISDLLLELRHLAQASGLGHLTYLLELAIYEAFEIANRRTPEPADFQPPKPQAGD